MISGILWDNDGVLVDTERIYFEVNRDYLRLHDAELSEEDFFNWFLLDNRGAWHLLSEKGITAEEIAALRKRRDEIYTARLLTESGLAVPGVERVLDTLSKRVEMGVVTSANREHYDAIHAPLTLNRHFKFVLTAETYMNSKPSPEPYLLGLKRLGLKGEECLVIEDSPRGLRAATDAGIRCIILRNRMTMHHEFTGAHRVVDSMDDLLIEIEALLR